MHVNLYVLYSNLFSLADFWDICKFNLEAGSRFVTGLHILRPTHPQNFDILSQVQMIFVHESSEFRLVDRLNVCNPLSKNVGVLVPRLDYYLVRPNNESI